MSIFTLTIGATSDFVSQPAEFQEIYTRYAAGVYRAAYRVTGSAEDAEDVLQTVFLRLLANGVTLDLNAAPEAYLRRAAVNAAIDLIRRRQARPESSIVDTGDASSSDRLLMKERIRRALAALPPRDAEMFVLCYIEGLTYEELASHFETERGTVAARLFRIRAVLQKEIGR